MFETKLIPQVKNNSQVKDCKEGILELYSSGACRLFSLRFNVETKQIEFQITFSEIMLSLNNEIVCYLHKCAYGVARECLRKIKEIPLEVIRISLGRDNNQHNYGQYKDLNVNEPFWSGCLLPRDYSKLIEWQTDIRDLQRQMEQWVEPKKGDTSNDQWTFKPIYNGRAVERIKRLLENLGTIGLNEGYEPDKIFQYNSPCWNINVKGHNFDRM